MKSFEESLHNEEEEDGGHIVSLMSSCGVVNFGEPGSYSDFHFAIVVQLSYYFDEGGGETILG